MGHRKIGIYGVGKRQKDFEYIFDDIKIDFYVEDDEYISETENILPVSKLTDKAGQFFLYICKEDMDAAVSKLQKMGLKSGDDFLPAEEKFPDLDFKFDNIPLNKTIAIWGKGFIFSTLVKSNKIDFSRISFIIDSNAKGEEQFEEIPIIRPEAIQDISDLFVIIAVKDSFRAIEKELQKMGISANDYISYERLCTNYAGILKKIYDAPIILNHGICNLPFKQSLINEKGDLMIACCWHNYIGIGNLWTSHYQKIWNSMLAKLFRLSVINGCYVFCEKEWCPYLSHKINQENNEIKDARQKKHYPAIVH